MAHKNLSGQIKAILPRIEERYAKQIFRNTASAVFDWLDSQTYFTNRSYNLRDSVGVGIYKNGILMNWYENPSPKATSAKKTTYHGMPMRIDGRSLLESAISEATTFAGQFATYTMIVFAKAPHGEWVDLGLGNPEPADSFKTEKKGFGWWHNGLVIHVQKVFAGEFNKVFNGTKTNKSV